MIHLRREAAGEPAGTLVLLHGRGADEHDLYPLLDLLDPERRLLGLTARGLHALPPGGWHWYRLGGIGTPEPETFRSSYEEVGEWLDGLERPLVLSGFSQGAVMTYALGLGRGRPRPAALVALSGFVPSAPGLELDLEPPLPPVAIGHGTYDPVIEVGWSRRARELLEGAGAEVRYREAPLPHTVDPGFLPELAELIRDATAA